MIATAGHAAAQPAENDGPVPPLPVVTPTPSNWAPKYPFPFDQTKNDVTEADITAQREMCQWYMSQYDELITQIDRFNLDLIASDGDWVTPGIVDKADAVTRNIDQSVAFLAPRAQALTMSKDYAGDLFFNLYQGESFYRLWQQLSNVSAGIRGRQPAWFVGPSYQHAQRMGSRVHRSHVCD
jgi:hypothetical protein